MPKNILIDLNIILDVLLDRRGALASRRIIELGESGGYTLYTSAHAVTTFAYLLEHAKVPRAEIRRQIDWLLKSFNIVQVDDALLEVALKSRLTDFEDAVVEQAALKSGSSVIITRNTKDFVHSRVKAIPPEEYLA